jgi:hypothetical protein
MSVPIIQIVNVKPGDILVVQTDMVLGEDQADKVAESVKTKIEAMGVTVKGVLVLPNGLHLNILREG